MHSAPATQVRALPTLTEDIVTVGVLAGAVVVPTASAALGAYRRRASDRAVKRRAAEGELAAIEASIDTEAFAPTRIQEVVERVLAGAETIWTNPSSRLPDDLPDRKVVEAWARLHARTTAPRRKGPASVEIVRVIHREADGEDMVELRVRQVLLRRRPWLRARSVRTNEHWTLVRDDAGWRLAAVRPWPETAETLTSQQVPSRAQDGQRVRQEVLEEIASDGSAPIDISEFIDPTRPIDAQLLELAAVDDRLQPVLLESTLRSIIDAWMQATTRRSGDLARYATNEVITQLTRPVTAWQDTRLRVRDASLLDWRVVAIGEKIAGTEIQIDLTIRAIRYLAYGSDRAGRRSQPPGNRRRQRPMALRWTLRSQRHPFTPWQLVGTSNPAETIPGS